MGWVRLRDTHFVSLPTAVFCVDCELISSNSTPACLACGSRAVLSLSRVLGGSLRGQPTANLIADAELDQLVRDLISTVPQPVDLAFQESETLPLFPPPSRHHVRALDLPASQIHVDQIDLEPAIHVIAERAQTLTGATGAAIALRRGQEIVCRARTGRTAPDLGVHLTTESGISAECIRTGEVVLCHDTEAHSRVDLSACRRLGVRSVLAAPLRHLRRTLGIFEVLSSAPHAFDDRDVSTMQLLSGVMVAAMLRLSSLQRREPRQSA